ncbi:MAG: pilus assembly protein N-terminal domain-containing protein [Alphaproteobacteria bacterium]
MKATRARKTAAVLALILSIFLLPRIAGAAETVEVVLDQAALMKLPDKVSTVVVGNPMIADIAIQSGGLMVVTGKGFGSTNLIALDRAGAVLMERSIVVSGPRGNDTVQVFRGVQRETFSCTPNCERRITLGDSADFFSAIQTQAETRNGAAASGGAAAAKAPAR